MKKKLIVANWKMHKTRAEALEFLYAFLPRIETASPEREVVICAPFTALGSLFKSLDGSIVRLGAQNIHWADEGAHTGSISGPMLADLNVDYVIVGHCERRQCRYLSDTDEVVNLRLQAAQRHGLTPFYVWEKTKGSEKQEKQKRLFRIS
jgi:triosephosphate isomerase